MRALSYWSAVVGRPSDRQQGQWKGNSNTWYNTEEATRRSPKHQHGGRQGSMPIELVLFLRYSASWLLTSVSVAGSSGGWNLGGVAVFSMDERERQDDRTTLIA